MSNNTEEKKKNKNGKPVVQTVLNALRPTRKKAAVALTFASAVTAATVALTTDISDLRYMQSTEPEDTKTSGKTSGTGTGTSSSSSNSTTSQSSTTTSQSESTSDSETTTDEQTPANPSEDYGDTTEPISESEETEEDVPTITMDTPEITTTATPFVTTPDTTPKQPDTTTSRKEQTEHFDTQSGDETHSPIPTIKAADENKIEADLKKACFEDKDLAVARKIANDFMDTYYADCIPEESLQAWHNYFDNCTDLNVIYQQIHTLLFRMKKVSSTGTKYSVIATNSDGRELKVANLTFKKPNKGEAKNA